MYDCEADNEDELSFEEGDVIMILAEETEDENWMEGILESDPERRGLFPSSFVHIHFTTSFSDGYREELSCITY